MSDWMDKYMYVCPDCGKSSFILDPSTYAYRIKRKQGDMYCCSYKCFRKYQKEHPIRNYNNHYRK